MPAKKIKQNPLRSRLRRIAGQIKGIEKMMAAKKDSGLVITQIMAAKAGLASLAVELLRQEAKTCGKKKIDKVVDTFFRLG